MQVNAETLQAKIDILEMLKQDRIISLNGEYQPEAYKMLLGLMGRYEDLLEAHTELLEVYDERGYD